MPRVRKPLPNLGPRESGIMRVLWQTPGHYQSVREVGEQLDAEIAYTTVMTLLSRLAAKGLVSRRLRGRGYAYRPRLSQSQYQARVMSSALHRDVDIADVLLHFVEDLTVQEQATLRELLQGES